MKAVLFFLTTELQRLTDWIRQSMIKNHGNDVSHSHRIVIDASSLSAVASNFEGPIALNAIQTMDPCELTAHLPANFDRLTVRQKSDKS